MGIYLPEWVGTFFIFWFVSYFAVMVAGMATDNWDVRFQKNWNEKQMLIWAFWIALVIGILALLPPMVSVFIVASTLVLLLVKVARRL